jgi:cell division protein FtsQ
MRPVAASAVSRQPAAAGENNIVPFAAAIRDEAPRFKSARKAPARRSRRARRLARYAFLGRLACKRGFGLFLTIAFLGFVGGAGAVRGGQYDRFVAEFGTLQDLGARAVGLSLEGVTIVGAKELPEDEILAASGITTRDSLPFLDVAAVRARIKEIPMVRDVSVRKLYPSRLLVEVQERAPYALWQVNGNVQVISADGMAIDQLADERQSRLPFVVGEDANLRVPEFLKILENAGDLRDQVRAGVLVSARRWNIKLASGLEVKLPEHQPEAAFAAFAKLSREMRILDKDLISVDLRIPDRMVARLTADAAATRADALAKKTRKGGQT